jgi:hypothetical protein
MAVLSDSDRALLHKTYMAEEDTPHGGVTKADIRAAINALDDFFDTNVTAINSAIPQPARAALTVAQKSRLVRYVIQKRYG